MEKQQFIDQLKKLISFKTVSGDIEENSKALDFVESILPKSIFVKRVKNKNAEVLIASTVKGLKPKIGYLVHIDVVSGDAELFNPKVSGDKVYGRGSSDMKFSIPLGVYLLKFAKENNIEFSLAITTDEEIGGYEGGMYLAKNLKFRPSCLIVPDGGDNLNFVNKSKGVCQIIVESKGATAHASRPWAGFNAINPLIILTNQLIKKYGKNSNKPNWKTTMNIGAIEGGKSVNQVCNNATIKFDFRYPESDSSERIVNEVKNIAKKISGNLIVTTASVGMPTFTNSKLPVVQKFISSMKDVYKKEIIIKETYVASDARHFSEFNIPILMMKPIAGEMHSENEWVSVTSALTFCRGLERFLKLYK
ncbi:MAG: M20 family metallopeptidase [Bacteroidales bacterium]|nr:M20 family metallopeptidase [Bacteroidales bacterium]